MSQIVAVTTSKENGQVLVADSQGTVAQSRKPYELLAAMVAPYPDCIKVCWNMQVFLAPLMKLLPAEVVKKLNQGESVWFDNFKLFYGVSNRGGGVLGVTWRVDQPIKEGSNIITRETFESNIYDISPYFPNETATTCDEIKTKGDALLEALRHMGIVPTKLTSPAAIYEETIFRKLPIPTISDMPEHALECAEWSANYVREWRSCYKIGLFPKVYDYDLSAGYPSVMAQLPNLKYATYTKTDGTILPNTYWAILHGKVNIWGNISPIVHADGKCYQGEYEDLITLDDWNCIRRWNIGDFQPDGAWCISLSKNYPLFDYSMRRLFDFRQKSTIELENRIAKNMANSSWGRFLETHGDKYGDYYMPPYASMVTSRVRCKDCDFIYSNHLESDVLSVTVDGCLSTKQVEGVGTNRKFGEWRLSSEGNALVLSSPFQWIADKRPAGKNLTEMMDAIHSHPMSRHWNGVSLQLLDHDRYFERLPMTGHDILAATYESKPLTNP